MQLCALIVRLCFLLCAVLGMCTLTFFDKFGIFLCVTMISSTILSICFFQSLLGHFGPPKHDQLTVPQLLGCMVGIVLLGLFLLLKAFSGGFSDDDPAG